MEPFGTTCTPEAGKLPDPRCDVYKGVVRAVIVVGAAEGSSDDWDYFSEQVVKIARINGIDAKYAEKSGPTPVYQGDEDAGSGDASAFAAKAPGYIVYTKGSEPTWVPHDMVDGVLAGVGKAVGFELLRPPWE